MRLSGYQKTKPPVHLEPWHHYLHGDPSERQNTLKLLSYNIQVGINTRHYQDYLFKAWQHFLPHHRREHNLQQIAELIQHFDLIALQEVDGGSFRSKYTNQIHYLAKAANKQFWHQQLNRNLGHFAQHSNGVIGNFKPVKIDNHSLPGIKGRGAIAFEIGEKDPLVVVVAHLALGKKHQDQQLKYIKGIIERYSHAVVMGDLNTDSLRILYDSPLKNSGLKASHARATYPSWRPVKCLDQILVSQHITIHKVGVLDFMLSDHLPVAIEIEVPN
jgi:endonuclease/exonuclease/phosphatase family metal-dependent hydrolase